MSKLTKKKALSGLTAGTPEYIIAHAEWASRRGKGRGPSLRYWGIRSPKSSLKAALEDAKKYPYFISQRQALAVDRDLNSEPVILISVHSNSKLGDMKRGYIFAPLVEDPKAFPDKIVRTVTRHMSENPDAIVNVLLLPPLDKKGCSQSPSITVAIDKHNIPESFGWVREEMAGKTTTPFSSCEI